MPIVKFQCDGAVQLYNAGTPDKPKYKVSCNCAEAYKAKSITASLPHHGYAAFVCDEEPPPESDNPVRYLTYSISCQGTSGCGEYQKNGELSWTHTIDPLTGISCESGDPNSVCWCLYGALTSCSETSLEYDCGELSAQEKQVLCCPDENADPPWPDDPLVPESCGENARKTQTHTLGSPYSLDAVDGNVSNLLSRHGFGELPTNAAGSVVLGTGHSILTWQPRTCNWQAIYSRSQGYVSRTKVQITFQGAVRYTLTTRLESGGQSSETNDAEAGTVLVINPPSEPGSVSFEPNCKTLVLPASIEIEATGSYTTRTPDYRNEQGEEVPCYDFFIGPDCKHYNHTVAESSATREKTSNSNSIVSSFDGQEETTTGTSKWNGTHSNTSSHQACRTLISSDRKTESVSSTFAASNPYRPISWERSCTYSSDNGVENWSPLSCADSIKDITQIPPVPKCNSGQTIVSSAILEPPEFIPGIKVTTTQDHYQISFEGKTVKWIVEKRSKSEYNQEDDKTIAKGTGTYSLTAQGTIVFSNNEGSESNPWKAETFPFCRNGENEDCVPFLGCVERYLNAGFSTQSDASVQIEAEINTPPGERNYEVWFHYYTTCSDTSNPRCQIITVEAFNKQSTFRSTGSQRKKISESISLSACGTDTKKCLSGVVVAAFAVDEAIA